MRIEIHTTGSPGALWTNIKKDIADEKIKTWSIVYNTNNEERLTHKPEQWFKKALLKPTTGTNPDRLILTVTWFTSSVPDEYTKGLYLGRFTEVLLEHYREDYSKLETYP